MEDIKCPCEECICVPICRHKKYISLFIECELLTTYEPDYDIYTKRRSKHINKLQNILKPSRWMFQKSDFYKHPRVSTPCPQ